ncbi:unnamed protein product [Moneuplotes crassus]|uniref:Uncharacterized protein n=1 Tax=Euplotes crassus TaxID=5936 RepID=A0AAD1XLP9_EUPCR|nr:unnamed protein product [Moneuplotes crassus]
MIQIGKTVLDFNFTYCAFACDQFPTLSLPNTSIHRINLEYCWSHNIKDWYYKHPCIQILLSFLTTNIPTLEKIAILNYDPIPDIYLLSGLNPSKWYLYSIKGSFEVQPEKKILSKRVNSEGLKLSQKKTKCNV